jgi:hypothetical protein
MHTFIGTNCSFAYNGDFSGEVIIRDRKTGVEVVVSTDDIAEFIVEALIKPRRIEKLEQASWEEVLDVKKS